MPSTQIRPGRRPNRRAVRTLAPLIVADGITAATAISVTTQVKAANATASGSQVRIAGTTLDSLMTAHGTGVKPGQVDIGFELARIAVAWYVTGMNLDF